MPFENIFEEEENAGKLAFFPFQKNFFSSSQNKLQFFSHFFMSSATNLSIWTGLQLGWRAYTSRRL